MKRVLVSFAAALSVSALALRAQEPNTLTIRPGSAMQQPLPIVLAATGSSVQPVNYQSTDAAGANVPGTPNPLPPGSPAVEPIPAPPASAQSTPAAGTAPPLSLDELIAMALAGNPTLAEASANIRALQGKWVQDGRYPNPRVQYKGDEMGDENRAGFQGFSVLQEVVTSHKLAKAQNIDSQQIHQAQQEYAAQEFRVRNDVKLRFYEVLLAQRTLELNQELERNSSAAVQAADDLFKAAEVGRGDVLQSRVEAELVQIQSIKARNAYQSAWRRLAAVVGMPELVPHPLTGDLRQFIIKTTWEESWARLFASSPELAVAQARVAAAHAAVVKAYADRCQNWEVELGYAHDNSTGFDTGAVMATVPVPLYNRNQGGIRQAQAQLSAAQAEVDRVALDLRNRLALIFERYTNAHEQVDRYEKNILPNANETLELTSSRYRAGEINFTALLVAQRTALQTQMSYLDALRELRETSVLIEGLLLSDSLSVGMK